MTQNIVKSKLSILIVLYKRHYKDSSAITTLLQSASYFVKKALKLIFCVE